MKSILAIFFLIISAISCAQSKKLKVYAYQQQVLPGVRAITIDESGTTKEVPNKLPPNTFIYLEAPVGYKEKIEPKHIWINGKLYEVKTTVANLPVIMHNSMIPNKKPDTLVRATENQVLHLQPVPADGQFNPSATAKKKMKTHQLVLHTIENGKNCYYYLESIKNLDPVALQ